MTSGRASRKSAPLPGQERLSSQPARRGPLGLLQRAYDAARHLRTGDSALLYGILSRACVLTVNVVTLLLLARFLTLQKQGYFYTFRSLLALQVFFELGLTTSLSAFFSHEFAHLSWGPGGTIVGVELARKRCLQIYRQSVTLFCWLSLAFFVVVAPIGYWFFAAKPEHGVAWQVPWLLAVLATAFFLYFTPHLALVMGSGDVAAVYKVWLAGAAVGGALAWTLLIFGHGLYAVLTFNLGNGLAALIYLWHRKRWLLRIAEPALPGVFSWRRELWPMQWRLALSWVSGYFIYSAFTPILFHYHGSAVAGRMGMTLNASNALLGVCLILITIQMPNMGKLIALRRYGDLDRLYHTVTIAAIAAAVTGACVGTIILQRLQAGHWNLGSRFLPWETAALIFASVILTVYINAAAVYLRSHKREPLMWQSIVAGIVQGGTIWWAGWHYGAMGEAFGFFITNVLFACPLIFLSHRYYRVAWHKDTAALPEVVAPPFVGS